MVPPVDQRQQDELNAWMTRLSHGDRDAVQPVFEALLPMVTRFTRRWLSGAPDADDAAQDALLKVFSRAHQYDPARGSALTWALGITAWECRTARRRTHRRKEGALGEAAPEAAISDDTVEQRDLLAALQDAMGQLAPSDQATLRQLLAGGRPCDVPAPTFRKRVERAVSRLRTIWRATHDIP